VLEDDLYVDDLATGNESEEEAVNLNKSGKTVIRKGGLQPSQVEL
jgi:hypothetical protein